jgi:hypothetical protein
MLHLLLTLVGIWLLAEFGVALLIMLVGAISWLWGKI